jgi:hypothetical protein
MTEDELDLLASAYLDGEATSEEVAMVERDPELLARFEARVEEMRAVSGQLGSVAGPPPALKEQHLAAAMATFDGLANDSAADQDLGELASTASAAAATEAENVVDFTARAQAQETKDRTSRAGRPGVGGLPNWMAAAAVFVLISGGLIALISSSGGDDETSFDAATGSTETEAGAEESADFGEDDAADESAAMLATEADAADDRVSADDEEAMEEAESEDAMEDDEAMEDTESADAAESAPTTTARTGGLFPQEPVLFFDELPQNLLAELGSVDELRDIADSNCAPELALADGVEAFGYVPVELAGLPAELFALVDQSGQELAILVEAEACIPIE